MPIARVVVSSSYPRLSKSWRRASSLSCAQAANRVTPAAAYAFSIATMAAARAPGSSARSSNALLYTARSKPSGKTAAATPGKRRTAAPRPPRAYSSHDASIVPHPRR